MWTADSPIPGILERLRSGDDREQDFRALFDQCFPRILSFFLAKGLSEEDARELTQGVMFSVYRSVGQLESEQAFAGWLFTIARNSMANWVDRRNAQKRGAESTVFAGEEFDFEDLRVDVGGSLLQREREELLREAVDALPPQMRQCVRIRVLEDAGYAQIASRLGISVNTVKAHLFQARNSLRIRLEGVLRMKAEGDGG